MAKVTQGADFQSMDDLTAALVIELQLEDAETVSSSFKGKAHEGTLSDAELALELYKQELKRNASIFSDRRMTRSIALAVQTDGNVLAESMSQEQSAARDRASPADIYMANELEPSLKSLQRSSCKHIHIWLTWVRQKDII
jgi:hypothetical protein